jgi:hypothetical protein
MRFMLGKGLPQSFEGLKRSLDDLRSYSQSRALHQMWHQKLGARGDELDASDAKDMRAYAYSARDHFSRALALLADGR